MLYEQATYRVGVIRLCNPGHVQIASVRFKSPGVAQSLLFLRMPLRCQLVPAEIRLRSSEPDHRTECEGAWALGLSRALLNPVTFLLDLLAVGRLVRSALLRHRRLLQAVEDRGLEALQNVA